MTYCFLAIYVEVAQTPLQAHSGAYFATPSCCTYPRRKALTSYWTEERSSQPLASTMEAAALTTCWNKEQRGVGDRSAFGKRDGGSNTYALLERGGIGQPLASATEAAALTACWNEERGGDRSAFSEHVGGSGTYSLLKQGAGRGSVSLQRARRRQWHLQPVETRSREGIGQLSASTSEAAALTACWNKEQGGDRSALSKHDRDSSTYSLLEQGVCKGIAFGERIGGSGTYILFEQGVCKGIGQPSASASEAAALTSWWKKEQRGDRSAFGKRIGGSGTYDLLEQGAGRGLVSLWSGEGIGQPSASASEAAALTICWNKERGGDRSAFGKRIGGSGTYDLLEQGAGRGLERGGDRSAFGKRIGGSGTYILVEKGAERGSVSLRQAHRRQRHLHAVGKRSREGIGQPSASASEAAAPTSWWKKEQGGDRSAFSEHVGGSGTYSLLKQAAGRGSRGGDRSTFGKHVRGSGTYDLLEQGAGKGSVSLWRARRRQRHLQPVETRSGEGIGSGTYTLLERGGIGQPLASATEAAALTACWNEERGGDRSAFGKHNGVSGTYTLLKKEWEGIGQPLASTSEAAALTSWWKKEQRGDWSAFGKRIGGSGTYTLLEKEQGGDRSAFGKRIGGSGTYDLLEQGAGRGSERGRDRSAFGEHVGGSGTYTPLEKGAGRGLVSLRQAHRRQRHLHAVGKRSREGIGQPSASASEAAALTSWWKKEQRGDWSAFGKRIGGSGTYDLLKQGAGRGSVSLRQAHRRQRHLHPGGKRSREGIGQPSASASEAAALTRCWKKEQGGDRSAFGKRIRGSGTYILVEKGAEGGLVSLWQAHRRQRHLRSVGKGSREGIGQPLASTSEAAALTVCWNKEQGRDRSAFGEHVGGSGTYSLLEKGAGRGSVSLWRACRRQRHLQPVGKGSREGIGQPLASVSEAAALTGCWKKEWGGDRSAFGERVGGSGTYDLLEQGAGRGSVSLQQARRRQRHLQPVGKGSREGIGQPLASVSEAAALTACWKREQGGDRSAFGEHIGGSGTYSLLEQGVCKGIGQPSASASEAAALTSCWNKECVRGSVSLW
ncbi:hypothetical protein B0H17DRAFT_1145858 [Mycena rosella]|uniref:Uncharacterized protein n=1 Tax=Mycena rosella TaxID=1033263 RepID=A0AAD7G5F3_MYCRO|nr:hypothetical protein B0H17DRAFT_1145858 [Mycena rosella]